MAFITIIIFQLLNPEIFLDLYIYQHFAVDLVINETIMERRIINIDPEILGGTPVFYGTRVPIKNLFDYLESGESINYFLEDFDGVQREQVVKVLEMSQRLIETSSNILNENFA